MQIKPESFLLEHRSEQTDKRNNDNALYCILSILRNPAEFYVTLGRVVMHDLLFKITIAQNYTNSQVERYEIVLVVAISLKQTQFHNCVRIIWNQD